MERERSEDVVEKTQYDTKENTVERTGVESLLNRCDSQSGDSYARANALQVNSQETLRTSYSLMRLLALNY